MREVPTVVRCGALVALVLGSLSAQAPAGWATEKVLGEGLPAGFWLGAGTWAADRQGSPAPFVQTSGLGNSLTGGGVFLNGGLKAGAWDLGAKVLAYREVGGSSRLRLSQGHIRYQRPGGWAFSLEREPLVWGYGLNGGYVLGGAAQPFPKLRVVSPFLDRSFFSVPLGRWKGEVFLGRLEDSRILSEVIQDPSYRSRFIAQKEDPQRPFLSGLRAEAAFGDSVEFYANWINLFGGLENGVSRTRGYGFGDYLTAFLGAKDTLAERGVDLNQPQPGTRPPEVKSASNADVGMRIRFRGLERLLGAEDVRAYVSRGSKAVNTIAFGLLRRQPGRYLGKDLDADWTSVSNGSIGDIWSRPYRYTAPSPQVPNDAVGILVAWPGWKVGLEYLDTVNSRNQFGGREVQYGHRSFTHYDYKTGFYYEGDALGSALGGEARYGTVHVQWEAGDRWTLLAWIHAGERPFRDVLADWVLDHPGKHPVRNRFIGLQATVEYRGPSGFLARGGSSFVRESAVLNEQGRSGTGFRWFLDLGWTWLRPGR